MTDPADAPDTLNRQRGMSAPPDPQRRNESQLGTSNRRGDVLGDRYEITERIASGGMASVWRANDGVLARTVAVKILHDHLAADEDFRERFRREAIAAAKLTHPNVVNLYDTGTDGDRVYLVMEFVDGETLKDVMNDVGVLPPSQAARIGEKIARALGYAHERGLVHRDIKPANILIGRDGAVKVADFGIAKAEDTADLTRTGMVLGTAAYVAPEQITGADVIDGRADQYALGCMLYEALTGQQPFKADGPVATAAKRLDAAPQPLRNLRPDVPAGLEAIVIRSLERHPGDRFPSAGAMAEALAAFADGDTGQTAALTMPSTRALQRGQRARAAPPAQRQARRPRRGLAVPLLALALVAVAVGVLAAFNVLAPDDGAPEQQDGGGASPDEAAPLDVAAITSFDPDGDGTENDEDLEGLVDSTASTTWRTDIYSTPQFGNLKDGVGVVFDLGEARQVSGLRGTTTTPGVSFDVMIADEPADDLSAWEPIHTAADVGRDVRVRFEPVEAGAVLVWITSPLPSDRRAEFTELVPVGPVAD